MDTDSTAAQLRAENATLRRKLAELETAQAIPSQTARDALQQLEDRFARLFASSPVSMAIIRLTDGAILEINPSFFQLTGIERTDVIGQTPIDLAIGFEPDVYQSTLQTLRTQDRVREINTQLRSASGDRLDVRVTAEPIPYETEACALLMIQDVSSQVRLKTQVHQSHKMETLGSFAAGIAHDFNNVLGVILGYADLTLYEVPQGSLGWRNLQEILQAARRAKDLVQQILSFSRQDEMLGHPTLLANLVPEALKFLRAFLPSTIDIQHAIPDDAGMVSVDPTKLHQVVMNLCANAEYAMRSRGGTLSITAEVLDLDQAVSTPHATLQPGSYVRLRIGDTGEGMPAAVAERIFEPYFTTKAAGEGTGMGLAVAHAIIAGYGGAITVQSTPGVGSTFDVYLPWLSEAVASAVTPPDMSIPSGHGTILFVDDEVMLADLGFRLLNRLGYEVTVQTDSREALEAFRREPDRFDLVITDQTMPHMTGERLVTELRRIRPDIRVILCTGFSHLMDADRAQTLGVDAFLMKPLELPELAAAIHQALTRHRENE